MSTDARARFEKTEALIAELEDLIQDIENPRIFDILDQLDELNVASARSMGLLVG